jgi:hypothetical protein
MKPLNLELQKRKDEAGAENDLTPSFTKDNSTINNYISNIYINDAESQRSILLEHIQQFGSVTTIEARREQDFLVPAPRIYGLRHWYGYQIDTALVYQQADCGKIHRIGIYVYRGDGNTKDLFGGV